MRIMDGPRLQLSIAGLLGLVACIAINVWLFRLHVLLGIVGLNVTKHIVIAYLCHAVGVDRNGPRSRAPVPPPAPSAVGTP
jgi:hypothetical protein